MKWIECQVILNIFKVSYDGINKSVRWWNWAGSRKSI